jgi:hypothetical protein
MEQCYSGNFYLWTKITNEQIITRFIYLVLLVKQITYEA